MMITNQEIIQLRERVNEIKTEKKFLSQQLNESIAEKDEAEIYGVSALEARAIIQTVAKSTQSMLEKEFSSLVTLAIRSIFIDEREFVIEFVEKRNKTEVECRIQKNNNDVNIFDGGGGQVDIISLATRLAFWNLNRKARPLFFLDEPIAFLHSPSYQERVSDLLQTLSKELNVQFVVVSDQQNIISDREFRVENGVVEVIE